MIPRPHLRFLGDPALREPASEVATFDVALSRLVAAMNTIMERANGVGLAAPQIGVTRRVFVWTLPDERRHGVCVNPIVTDRDDALESHPEGCLSIPGVACPTPRAAALRLQAQDLRGQPTELRAEGLLARILQHEVDHLDGVLFIDRLDRRSRVDVLRRAERVPGPLAGPVRSSEPRPGARLSGGTTAPTAGIGGTG